MNLANEKIESREVFLVTDQGTQVMKKEDAIQLAKSAKLDLVKMGDRPDGLPVCKILDHSRMRFEQKKKKKESKKKVRVQSLKTLRLRPAIGEGDLQTKLKQAQKFLDSGDKVKFLVMFRGRERAHKGLGFELLDKVKNSLRGDVDQAAKPEGQGLSVVFKPS